MTSLSVTASREVVRGAYRCSYLRSLRKDQTSSDRQQLDGSSDSEGSTHSSTTVRKQRYTSSFEAASPFPDDFCSAS